VYVNKLHNLNLYTLYTVKNNVVIYHGVISQLGLDVLTVKDFGKDKYLTISHGFANKTDFVNRCFRATVPDVQQIDYSYL